MGDKIARLYDLDESENNVPLAGITRVKAYMRKGKDGKTVAVSAYTRSVSKMSFNDLQEEFKSLNGKTDPQSKNRLQQVIGEIRFRGFEPGDKWDPEKGKEAHRRGLERAKNNHSKMKDSWKY